MFVSDTAAGSANQTWFENKEGAYLSRVYYRLSQGGTQYILAYSDVIDGTFADGSHSVCNAVCGGWEIVSLRVGLCPHSDMQTAVTPTRWQHVTFDGAPSRLLRAGETVHTDPIALMAAAGDTLCVELCADGCHLPCHEELQIASFVKKGEDWCPSAHFPVPLKIDAKKDSPCRIGFLGDSITQGIGATPNAYRHWVACVARALGARAACRNVGIGFGRASDPASFGAWFERAAENDIVVLCLGVNDLICGRTAKEIAADLKAVLDRLHAGKVRVLLQSVPPFEFTSTAKAQWCLLNDIVRETLAPVADAFLDTSFLGDNNGRPLYGGHPNDEGCVVWAETLTPLLEAMLDRAKTSEVCINDLP